MDTKLHKEPTPGKRTGYLYNVAASTQKALEARGLVEVTKGIRTDDPVALFLGPVPVCVRKLTLTDAGRHLFA